MLYGGKKIVAGGLRFGAALLIVFGVLLQPYFVTSTQGITLKELERKQQEAQQKANQYQNQANQKSYEVNNLNSVVQGLNSNIADYQRRIATTQSNLTITQQNITKTEQQIKIKEVQLADNQHRQGETLQAMYIMGRESTIETFISSSSLSDVVARDQYVSALESNIEQTMREIKKLKGDLESKKKNLTQKRQDLVAMKEQLQLYNTTVITQRNQQNILLNGALSEKTQLLNSLSAAKQEVAQISDAIYKMRLANSKRGNERVTRGGGGYPYTNYGGADKWGFIIGQCTSYAAWYWNVILHKPWNNSNPVHGRAKYWADLTRMAPNNQYHYSVSKTPRVGAIIVWYGPLFSGDQWGHVAIVRKVNSNGIIDISEYNYIAPNSYSYRTNVNPAAYGRYDFIY